MTQYDFALPEPSKPTLYYQVTCQLVGNVVIPAALVYMLLLVLM
jgi:hypothetical protein